MTSTDPHQFSRDAWETNAEVWDARMGDEGNDFFNTPCVLTACITDGWEEKGSEVGNCQSSETTPKNAHSPRRPVHAVLGRFETDILS